MTVIHHGPTWIAARRYDGRVRLWTNPETAFKVKPISKERPKDTKKLIPQSSKGAKYQ